MKGQYIKIIVQRSITWSFCAIEGVKDMIYTQYFAATSFCLLVVLSSGGVATRKVSLYNKRS